MRNMVKTINVTLCAIFVWVNLIISGYAGNMVAAWDFESGLADVWTNNLGGTAVNGATNIANVARHGNVLILNDDSNQYVNIADSDVLDFTGTATIAAWIYAEGGPDCVLSKGVWDTAYTIRLDSGGSLNKINFHGNTVISANAISVGQWVHIAVTHDAGAVGAETRIYINGVLDATRADAGNLVTNNDPMEIGHAKSADPWGYWKGMIDDVALWNSSLSEGDIRALYNLGVNADIHYSPVEVQQLLTTYEGGAGSSTNIGGMVWVYSSGLSAASDGELAKIGIYYALVIDATAGTGMTAYISPSLAGCWNFESGVADVSTNALGGTAINGATTAADATRNGNVLVLDHTSSQYVQVPDNDVLDLTATATIAAWVYATYGGPDCVVGKGAFNDAYSIRLDDSADHNKIDFHGDSIISSNSVADATWVHIAVTHDAGVVGAETCFYINGALDVTRADAGDLSTNTDILEIGHSRYADPWGYWTGKIDDMVLWNARLSAGEIRAVYNLGSNADLHYSPAEVQQLFTVYEGGAGSSVMIGDHRWLYASGLTGTSNGQLNVPGTKGTYEVVMDATRGTGVIVAFKGTLILIN